MDISNDRKERAKGLEVLINILRNGNINKYCSIDELKAKLPILKILEDKYMEEDFEILSGNLLANRDNELQLIQAILINGIKKYRYNPANYVAADFYKKQLLLTKSEAELKDIKKTSLEDKLLQNQVSNTSTHKIYSLITMSIALISLGFSIYGLYSKPNHTSNVYLLPIRDTNSSYQKIILPVNTANHLDILKH